ncbi:MAG: ROK family protein, partial [Hyphomicrobiaceae bacterium]
MTALDYRIGLDLGGTKIAGIIFDRDDRVLDSQRRPTPRGDYAATLQALMAMARELSARHAGNYSVGVGIPGSLRPGADTVQNANSTWLNGQSVGADFEQLLGQPVRCENDANCFALSEAHDGAAQGKRSVFGVILGTGCGGGLVFDGRLVSGPRNIGGEWGHNPLP